MRVRSCGRHDTARHSTTQHDTARHSTTQYNTTQHNTSSFRTRRTPAIAASVSIRRAFPRSSAIVHPAAQIVYLFIHLINPRSSYGVPACQDALRCGSMCDRLRRYILIPTLCATPTTPYSLRNTSWTPLHTRHDLFCTNTDAVAEDYSTQAHPTTHQPCILSSTPHARQRAAVSEQEREARILTCPPAFMIRSSPPGASLAPPSFVQQTNHSDFLRAYFLRACATAWPGCGQVRIAEVGEKRATDRGSETHGRRSGRRHVPLIRRKARRGRASGVRAAVELNLGGAGPWGSRLRPESEKGGQSRRGTLGDAT